MDDENEERITSGDVLTEGTLVRDVLEPVVTRACTVWPGAEIEEIARAAARQPDASSIAVVDENGVLQGVISRTTLFDELFLYIEPEAFLHDVLRSGNIEELGRLTRGQTAGNLMASPLSVHLDDTLGVAFERMHDGRLEGLPIVDEDSRVVGYLSRLQLMLAWLRLGPAARLESPRPN
jgi:CBS domain-containing protein